MSKHIQNTLTSLLSILVFFGVLEVAARLCFPEFQNQIHSAHKTLGINYFLSKSVPGRVPSPDYPSHLNKPLILILGDSISHGYGQAYEDIYWVRLQRLMQLQLGADTPEFISLSYYGNDLNGSINELQKFLHKYDGVSVSEIIYQFNFNDIVPEAYGRSNLHHGSAVLETTLATAANRSNEARHSAGLTATSTEFAKETTESAESDISRREWFKTLSRWRSEYLNYSVLLRVAQHYAGAIVRQTSGSCEDRDLHTLGPYTWTFGSRKYAKESEALWQSFVGALTQLKTMADARQIKLSMVVSPLLFDIDTDGIHPYYNYLNYDFSCGTIDPRARLASVAENLGVSLYDPTQFIKSSFDARVKEGNFTPFFFTADENHITPVVSSLMADYLHIARTQKGH